MAKYRVTGNEYLSLPTLRESDGALEGVTFLYMQAKGMLELRGNDALIAPYWGVEGQPLVKAPQWRQTHEWIPEMTCKEEPFAWGCTYLAPVGERGIGFRLWIRNEGSAAVTARFGLRGSWDQTLHEVNETIEIPEGRQCRPSEWNHLFVWSQRTGLPLFAFAPITEDLQPFGVGSQGAQCKIDGFSYDLFKEISLEAGHTEQLDVFWGVGYEEVAATTSAKELLRQGFDALYAHTCEWLTARKKSIPDEKLCSLLNRNLFFALFFASGMTVDTEELCLMTSRSPRYYVSAAYWDRDSLLWAFPAILLADAEYARKVLLYAFTRQSSRFGVHSRYIDGTMLEPGFELDELCAPVIALWRYVEATGEREILSLPPVVDGLRHILRSLESHKHSEIALYDTFLQPTDDLRRYPYLTYDNMLVWFSLRALADLLMQPELAEQAEEVKRAIEAHCIKEKEGKRFFAWSVDLRGGYDLYDEPPGSLLLLPHYGFCSREDEVWKNTVAMIRDPNYAYSFAGEPIAEIGCAHAPHPWVLSICNSLLSGFEKSALAHLRLTELDNGVACESVDEKTGECATGEAFATCAGFLAYALWQACGQA